METKSYDKSVNDKEFKKLRVLLVGVEELVKDVRDGLRQAGHDVITRDNAEDAQEFYEKELRKFDVVYHMFEVKRDSGILVPESAIIDEDIEVVTPQEDDNKPTE